LALAGERSKGSKRKGIIMRRECGEDQWKP